MIEFQRKCVNLNSELKLRWKMRGGFDKNLNHHVQIFFVESFDRRSMKHDGS